MSSEDEQKAGLASFARDLAAAEERLEGLDVPAILVAQILTLHLASRITMNMARMVRSAVVSADRAQAVDRACRQVRQADRMIHNVAKGGIPWIAGLDRGLADLASALGRAAFAASGWATAGPAQSGGPPRPQ